MTARDDDDDDDYDDMAAVDENVLMLGIVPLLLLLLRCSDPLRHEKLISVSSVVHYYLTDGHSLCIGVNHPTTARRFFRQLNHLSGGGDRRLSCVQTVPFLSGNVSTKKYTIFESIQRKTNETSEKKNNDSMHACHHNISIFSGFCRRRRASSHGDSLLDRDSCGFLYGPFGAPKSKTRCRIY
jgi:hypothetical protein